MSLRNPTYWLSAIGIVTALWWLLGREGQPASPPLLPASVGDATLPRFVDTAIAATEAAMQREEVAATATPAAAASVPGESPPGIGFVTVVLVDVHDVPLPHHGIQVRRLTTDAKEAWSQLKQVAADGTAMLELEAGAWRLLYAGPREGLRITSTGRVLADITVESGRTSFHKLTVAGDRFLRGRVLLKEHDDAAVEVQLFPLWAKDQPIGQGVANVVPQDLAEKRRRAPDGHTLSPLTPAGFFEFMALDPGVYILRMTAGMADGDPLYIEQEVDLLVSSRELPLVELTLEGLLDAREERLRKR